MPKTDFDVCIIGGGIVGLATAYQLCQTYPKLRIGILEKEAAVAQHQTGHNSGVIHSGLYYKPGSLKARLCTRGRRALTAFARAYDIPHEICGKIVVATDPKELPRLAQLYERGQANEIEGLEKITGARITELEPYFHGIEGLSVPCTGIIDFVKVAQTLARLVQEANPENQVLCSRQVTGFERHDFSMALRTQQGPVKSLYVINCSGLQSDRIASLDGIATSTCIVPFRGEYYDLTPEAASKVKNLVYPVPDPKFPFLGVHFTRTIDGLIDCGPNAVFAFKREGYSKTAFSFRDTFEALAFPGTLRLFAKNIKYGLDEYARSMSKALFLKQLQRLMPSLESTDIIPGKIGIRAQAVSRNGTPVDDFKIETRPRTIHVLNAPSPAATACLAIGEHLCQLAGEQFEL
ncbi:MAG: L-2-hydroxyglutarate oxidase [Phycisphaerae bacterium]|nr:L-2-hydroxyglutarate oxidase [Phycisphaerae bacterium]